MNKVMVKSRYDEEHMGYLWYVVVDDVQTQGYDSPWYAVVAGVDILRDDDVDDYLWNASMFLSAIYDEPAIRVYKNLRDLIEREGLT